MLKAQLGYIQVKKKPLSITASSQGAFSLSELPDDGVSESAA